MNICEMDDATGLCVGCARTIDEIMAWSGATPAWRATVMADLPARRDDQVAARITPLR